MSAAKQSRKPYIITGALFAYAIMMAVLNLDTITVHHNYLRYFGTLGAELIILCFLFIFLRKREKLKTEREADLKAHENKE